MNYIKILFENDNYLKFIPNKNMTRTEQYYSIIRFSIYLIIIFTLLNSNIFWYLIPIIILLIIFLLIFIGEKDIINESFCNKSTLNNPFMNNLITEKNNKNPCNDKKNVDDNFFYNYKRNVDDLFDVKNSRRQFYTLPNTKISNDRDKFMNMCYKIPNNCKTNNYECSNYRDIKYDI